MYRKRRKQRDVERLLQAGKKTRQMGGLPVAMNCMGALTSDRSKWRDGAMDFLTQKHNPEKLTEEKEARIKLVQRLREKLIDKIPFGAANGEVIPTFTEFLDAVASSPMGSGVGNDNVPAEAWLLLPWSIKFQIYLILRRLLGGAEFHHPPSWATLSLVGIPKSANSSWWSEYRWISLCPTLQKVFFRVLIRKGHQQRKRFPKYVTCCGFRQNRAVSLIVDHAAAVLRFSKEMKGLPAYLLSLDVKWAFDNLTLETMVEAFIWAEYPMEVVVALAQLWLNTWADIQLSGTMDPEEEEALYFRNWLFNLLDGDLEEGEQPQAGSLRAFLYTLEGPQGRTDVR